MLICVGVVPLIGRAMLRLTCSVTRVPGVRFGRCWLAYLAAYVAASIVGVPLLLLLPRQQGVPTFPTVIAWLVVALLVHALIVPRVLGTPLRRTLVAHAIALALTGCVTVALALPAVILLRAGARRVVRAQQFVQLREAMDRFTQETEGQQFLMPAAIYSADGRPLLSWRVALLPYLDRQDLYDQFRLDEPWDSPHNLSLVGRMPRVYREGDEERDREGKTRLRILTSSREGYPQTPFVLGERRGLSWGAITSQDGSMATALVLELAEPTIWTNPDEPRYVPGGLLPRFGHPERDDGVHVLFADGSVRLLPADSPPGVWEARLTWNGREPEHPY